MDHYTDMAIQISNDSLEDLIFSLYGSTDTIQAVSLQKFSAPAMGIYSIMTPSEGTFMLHVYRPGLFLRTRLSDGYGFPISTGYSYRVKVIEKDDQGNDVSVKREDMEEYIASRAYHFGDMILNPSPPVPAPPPPQSQLLAESAERKRLALEKAQKIRAESYEALTQNFAIAVEVAISGSSISESQIAKLWETAKPLQAADAAQILANHVRGHQEYTNITHDIPGVEAQFTTVLQLLLAGQTIDANQLDLLANIGSRLTKDTVATVITRLLRSTYNARVTAKKAGGDEDIYFRNKFTTVLQAVAGMDTISSSRIELLLSAASTLSPVWVQEALQRENTSWDDLMKRAVTTNSSAGQIPPLVGNVTGNGNNVDIGVYVEDSVPTAASPPPPPPRQDQNRHSADGMDTNAVDESGQDQPTSKPSDAASPRAAPAGGGGTTTSTLRPLEPRRPSIGLDLQESIRAGRDTLKRMNTGTTDKNKFPSGSIFEDLAVYTAVRQEGDEIYDENMPESNDEEWA